MIPRKSDQDPKPLDDNTKLSYFERNSFQYRRLNTKNLLVFPEGGDRGILPPDLSSELDMKRFTLNIAGLAFSALVKRGGEEALPPKDLGFVVDACGSNASLARHAAANARRPDIATVKKNSSLRSLQTDVQP